MNATSGAKLTCPHCQAMTSADTGFCDECGLELTTQALKPVTAAQVMASGELARSTQDRLVCPFCGHSLRPNARHCSNCGKKLPREAQPAAAPEPQTRPDSALRPGLIVADRYGLENILGEGGMGRAWKAFDQHLNKYVVIKTMVTPDDKLREELRKEAEFLINVRHPNIIAVIDFFSVADELCYVMEFVGGPSWADEIEEPVNRKLVLPMSAEQALTRVKGLLPAFKYLHGLNPPIIYCDFKPSNVKRLLLSNGDEIEVLLDFGTAYRYDPDNPPKPARGTPGYHSNQALHPDWRDDYFTIGRTIAELVGMAEVHTEQYRYTLTPADQFPWIQYDVSLRYLVEWLTAPARQERPQNVDEILVEIDGVLGYVKGQKPDARALAAHRQKASFKGVTVETMRAATGTGLVTGTAKIDLPGVPTTNPAATVLLSAQEAYHQRDLTRALLLANQAINNNGGAAAYVLRSLIYNQEGRINDAAQDLDRARQLSDPQIKWEMLLAEGQLLENQGQFEAAAAAYQKLMALKPGDHRGRLLLADLYRRSGNTGQAITEYQSIMQAKPSVGQAYIGASRAYLVSQELDNAIRVLETVSSRNTSYNEVMMELIALYNQKAVRGSADSLEQAARAIAVLRENGVESRVFYRLVGEFYHTAYLVARQAGKMPKVNWPDEHIRSLRDLSVQNERAWRDYLARDADANRRTSSTVSMTALNFAPCIEPETSQISEMAVFCDCS
ncbi:MAG TPA: tetratricopeptide repeat protein [Phototrophicaceae bacterium]|nr:tetratricopeptide repeat protein [Phototrophicaceae bacterium]